MINLETKKNISNLVKDNIPKIDNKLDRLLLSILKYSNIDISFLTSENKEELLLLAREAYFKG